MNRHIQWHLRATAAAQHREGKTLNKRNSNVNVFTGQFSISFMISNMT